MKDLKVYIIGIILILISLILLANNVKKIDKENRKMTIDWKTYTCDIE